MEGATGRTDGLGQGACAHLDLLSTWHWVPQALPGEGPYLHSQGAHSWITSCVSWAPRDLAGVRPQAGHATGPQSHICLEPTAQGWGWHGEARKPRLGEDPEDGACRPRGAGGRQDPAHPRGR